MFDHLIDSFRRGRERARAARQLRAMSPRLLRDLGIEADQIDDCVYGRTAR